MKVNLPTPARLSQPLKPVRPRQPPRERFIPSLHRHSEGLVRLQAGALGALAANAVAGGATTVVAALAGLGPLAPEGLGRLGLGMGVALAAAGVGYLGFKAGTAWHGHLSKGYDQKLAGLPPVLARTLKTSSYAALGLVPLGLAVSAYTGLDAGWTLGAGALALGATAWFQRQP